MDGWMDLEADPICTLHHEKFKLYCLDHQENICVICRDSKDHRHHRFIPVNEAAQENRKSLRGFLDLVQQKLKFFEQVKEVYDETVKHIPSQSQQTEKQIREEFKKIRQFLEKEEEARVSALKKEEEQKTQRIKDKSKGLLTNIAILSRTIGDTERDLKVSDVCFLQNYDISVGLVQESLLLEDPKLIPGSLIDVPKHVGNLGFNVWNKMKEVVSYSPVILEDLTCVGRENTQRLPENPERIQSYPAVLGSEGFDKQTHTWDVQVENCLVWSVGVSAKNSDNGSEKTLKLTFCGNKYTAESGKNAPVALTPKSKVKTFRLQLDCDKRKLSLLDVDTNTNIHTFTHTSTEKLYPYFNVVNSHPLKIVPLKLNAGPA